VHQSHDGRPRSSWCGRWRCGQRRAAATLPLPLERRSSSYTTLGATTRGRKMVCGESHPYLGFGGHGEATTRVHDGGLLPCLKDFDEGGTPVISWPKWGMGRHQGAPRVLLVQAVERGWLWISSAMVVVRETSDGWVFVLKKVTGGKGFYRGKTLMYCARTPQLICSRFWSIHQRFHSDFGKGIKLILVHCDCWRSLSPTEYSASVHMPIVAAFT
jgi:hypothetical protein